MTVSLIRRLNLEKSWSSAVHLDRHDSWKIDVSGTSSTQIAPAVGWYRPSSVGCAGTVGGGGCGVGGVAFE